MANTPPEILMVEDNSDDAALMIQAFEKIGAVLKYHRAGDADSAFRYLRHSGEYLDAKRPDLILLDVKLPGKNGLEILAEIRKDADLKSIPVVVLSTSPIDNVEFIRHGLEPGHCFIKPYRFADYLSIAESVRYLIMKDVP